MLGSPLQYLNLKYILQIRKTCINYDKQTAHNTVEMALVASLSLNKAYLLYM